MQSKSDTRLKQFYESQIKKIGDGKEFLDRFNKYLLKIEETFENQISANPHLFRDSLQTIYIPSMGVYSSYLAKPSVERNNEIVNNLLISSLQSLSKYSAVFNILFGESSKEKLPSRVNTSIYLDGNEPMNLNVPFTDRNRKEIDNYFRKFLIRASNPVEYSSRLSKLLSNTAFYNHFLPFESDSNQIHITSGRDGLPESFKFNTRYTEDFSLLNLVLQHFYFSFSELNGKTPTFMYEGIQNSMDQTLSSSPIRKNKIPIFPTINSVKLIPGTGTLSLGNSLEEVLENSESEVKNIMGNAAAPIGGNLDLLKILIGSTGPNQNYGLF